MCRLLAVKSSKKQELSSHLESFANICKNSKEYQGHGWGLAYLKNDSWEMYKSLTPIWEDDLRQFESSSMFLVHARSAFRDEGIAIENNMPFYDESYIYIFNGELQGVKIKEEGRIGAEKIFNFIKRFDRGDIAEAIKRATSVIAKRTRYIRAMNFIICDKSHFYVFNSFGEDQDYFQMYRKMGDGVIVCSESHVEGDWDKVGLEKVHCY